MKKIIAFLGVLIFFILSSSRVLAYINCGPSGKGKLGQGSWFCINSGTCLLPVPGTSRYYGGNDNNGNQAYCQGLYSGGGASVHCCVDYKAVPTPTPTTVPTPTSGGPTQSPTATPVPCSSTQGGSYTNPQCIGAGHSYSCDSYGQSVGAIYTHYQAGDHFCRAHDPQDVCCVFVQTSIEATATGYSGGGSVAPPAATIPVTAVCKDLSTNGKQCDTIQTGVGLITTSASKFINSIFTIVLSISGGIALILIIVSGYQLSLSSGNPEKVKEAQGMLTAAIVGFVFILFSVAILQIIGVDILGSILPTFGR